MAPEQITGQRSRGICEYVAGTRVSPGNDEKLKRFDETSAEQGQKNGSSKANAVQGEADADGDEEENVQEEIDGGPLPTLQTPEGNPFGACRWSEGDNGDCYQTGQ